MVNVYIITKNGSGFTDEGLNEVKKMIRKRGDNRSIAYQMGSNYNSAAYLSECLKATKEKYLLFHELSEDEEDGSLVLIDAGFEVICAILDKMPDANSWAVLHRLLSYDQPQ